MMMTNGALISKYNVPAPRYTSYPPIPVWNNEINQNSWIATFQNAYGMFGSKDGISLYIHLPYCESLCTYCGCNKRITKNHQVEIPYISTIMKEWNQYLDALTEKPTLAGIHLGGGTPTFFSPSTLDIMLKHLLGSSNIKKDAEFSFEGHPNNTTNAHLKVLLDHGFDRVSYGIQDFDPTVQKAINRIQPFEKVREVTLGSRNMGYTSINFDLIYGLPHQNLQTLEGTFEKVAELMPDRIAFYSYAHVPSSFPSQKSFEEFLPNEQEKRALYERGKVLLLNMGYQEVGMDHFALPGDPLINARENNTLHRNFMGYTTSPSKILLGLGCSAISDIHLAYAQNEKRVEQYKSGVLNGNFPIVKGHLHSEADLQFRSLILHLICNGHSSWPLEFDPIRPDVLTKLMTFKKEGLIQFDAQSISITTRGKPFVRNICMALDPYFKNKEKTQQVFSKAI
jgi:oxygen-independent coproporphyrinogen III oxidase